MGFSQQASPQHSKRCFPYILILGALPSGCLPIFSSRTLQDPPKDARDLKYVLKGLFTFTSHYFSISNKIPLNRTPFS